MMTRLRTRLGGRLVPGILVLALLGILAGVRTRFQCFLVVGDSMEPTLRAGDVLIVDRAAYRGATPVRDDIVVVRYRGEPMVKRVVGLPGEEVEVRASRLYIDGRTVPTGHGILTGYLDIGRGHLASDRYAVLGDNRSMSPEETVHAVVGTEAMTGRVIGRISWRDRQAGWVINPQGCQRVAGGRQTSGTVGKKHSTRNGSQTDVGGRDLRVVGGSIGHPGDPPPWIGGLASGGSIVEAWPRRNPHPPAPMPSHERVSFRPGSSSDRLRALIRGLVSSILGGLLAGAWAPAAAAAERPRLIAGETVVELGRVPPTTRLEPTLTLANAGDVLLEVGGFRSSCSCLRPSVEALKIAAGERATLTLGLHTSDLSGPFSEWLTLTSNDPEQPELRLEVRGTVFRLVEAVPPFVKLEITPDSWADTVVTTRILNHGERPITVEDPVGSNPAFAARLVPHRPGFEYALEIRATRVLGTGNHYGKFTLPTSAPEAPKIEVTAFVPGLPAVVATPRTLPLPAAPASNRVVRTVLVRGTTDHRLRLERPRFDGPPVPAGVAVSVTEREAGRLFALVVEFPPGFAPSATNRLALAVDSNHPQFPTLRIPILPAEPATNEPAPPRPGLPRSP
jgi:signal peptidase I